MQQGICSGDERRGLLHRQVPNQVVEGWEFGVQVAGAGPGAGSMGVFASVEIFEGSQSEAFVAMRREVLDQDELGECVVPEVEIEVGPTQVEVRVDVARPAGDSMQSAADDFQRLEILFGRRVRLATRRLFEGSLRMAPSATLDLTAGFQI